MSGLSVLALAVVLLYRPLKSGIVQEYSGDVLFGTLLMISPVTWVASLVLDGRISVKLRFPIVMALVYVGFTAVSVGAAHYRFPALHLLWVLGGYFLVFFMTLQHAGHAVRRRFLTAVVFASVVTVACYAVFHYYFYLAAMRRWLESDPKYFQTMLGVRGRMFVDLEDRIRTRRAYGNFLTPNQLADFLILGFAACAFVLARLAARGRRAAAVAVPVALVLLGALLLSGSKGGILSFLAACFVFGLLAAGRLVVPRLKRGARAAFVGVVIAGCCVFAGLAAHTILSSHSRLGQAMARSLGVRVGYWAVTLDIIERHPLRGVGPGNWNDDYSRLKGPEKEETQLPHSDYLQIAAESGIPTVLAYIAFWGVLLGVAVFKRPPTAKAPPKVDAEAVRTYLIAGVVAAVVIFGIDHIFVGTFRPPREGAGQLLRTQPWLPAAGLCVVWILVFAAALHQWGTQPEAATSPRLWEMRKAVLVAGLAGFLIHSAAEFTLVIGAIGTLAFFLGALLCARFTGPPRRWKPGPRLAFILFAPVAALTVWVCVSVTQRVLTFKLNSDVVFGMKDQIETVRPNLRKLDDAIRLLEEATKAVPIEADTHQQLGDYYLLRSQLLTLRNRPEQAAESRERAFQQYKRALDLNPRKGKYHVSLGRFYQQEGHLTEAAAEYLKAAECSPSRPLGWFTFAETVVQVEGYTPRVCEALRKAMELDPLQYHERNKLTEAQRARARAELAKCPSKPAPTKGE